jgi:hypothetical protein
MNKTILYCIIASLSLMMSIMVSMNTFAVSNGEAGSNIHYSGEEIAAFAKQVEKTLAKKGARVFIVGRVGRPAKELPAGIHYTHTAFGVYSMITTEDGRTVPGYAMYNLYQREGQPHISDLVTDFPADFFASVQEMKAGIVIPTPVMQRRLLNVINSELYQALHVPQYSAIANPYTLAYQNCTEHVLDVINAAIYQTHDIEQIKRNTTAYFEAQLVNISPLKLMLGNLLMKDVTTSDHNGPVVTATFNAIANYMDTYGLVSERFEIESEIH